jgi:threonine/homoserine/homoserine lactone efflux protein
MPQAIALGALFVAIAAITDSAYAIAAGTFGPALGRSQRAQGVGRWLPGLTFIGLGLFAALGGADQRRTPTAG